MQQETPSGPNSMARNINWVELVLFLSDMQYLEKEKAVSWSHQFARVTIAGPGERPVTLPTHIRWYSYRNGDPKSRIWNRLLQEAKAEWVLFLEDDEQVMLSDFPARESINRNCWSPALISYFSNEKDKERRFYQIRLVPQTESPLFDGNNLPDCTRYFTEYDYELANKPLFIERSTDPLVHVDPDLELSVQAFAPKVYLVQGDRFFRQGKYVHAAAQYRRLLKKEKLLPFDRLGAVNGLTSCLAEQFKWPQAMALAQKSIEAEPLQKLPYLIQYQIFQLSKQWDEALEVLDRYYELINLPSKANFDKAIDEEETLLNLADLALKGGSKKQASEYFEKLFLMKDGDVERSFLERLLLLSIELSDYERSVFFFQRMFDDLIPDKFDEEQEQSLHDYMSMFMRKGWYDFVFNIYNQLYTFYPENNEYKRRLIVTLSKTDRLEKARKLIAS